MPETRPEQSEISKRHIPIIGELTVRAARHIKQFDSLELLDPEWVNLGHHIKGKPLPYKEMSEKAEEAFDDFPDILEQLDIICAEADALTASTDPKRECNPLRQAVTALERGDNVILGTNHFELTDIAKIFAGINVWLAKAGYEQLLEGDSNVKRALIASQITSVMGIKMRNPDTTEGQPPTLTVPVTLALTALVHDLLKSYPNTPSIAAIRKLWEAETTLNNLRVKGTVMSLQKAGRLFLAMAPSGSQDKPLEGDPTTYLLQPLTQGTLDMMKQTRTYVLMMAMWNVEGKPIVRFSGREINGVWVPNGLASIKNDHQGNAEMTNLSTTLNHWVPGLHFVYLPAVTRDSKKKRRSSDY